MTNLPTFRWEHLPHSRSPTVRKLSVVYVSVGNWEGDWCQGWPWAGGREGRGNQGHPSSSNALPSQLSEGGWVWMKSYGVAVTAPWSSGILGSFLSLSDLICPARLMIEILSAIHKMLCESNYMYLLLSGSVRVLMITITTTTIIIRHINYQNKKRVTEDRLVVAKGEGR